MASAINDDLEEFTDCVICLEAFVDPMKLRCDHTFCKSCVTRMTEGDWIRCPICKQLNHADRDVKPDFRINKFIEALRLAKGNPTESKDSPDNVTSADEDNCELCECRPISHWCQECAKGMCAACKKGHLKIGATRNHTLMLVSEWIARQPITVHMYETLAGKMLKCQAAIETYYDGLQEIKLFELKRIEEINQLEKEVHIEITAAFKDYRNRIEEESGRLFVKMESRVELLKTEFSKSSMKADDLGDLSSIRSIAKFRTVSRDIERYLRSIPEPEVVLEVPEVKFERNTFWKAADVARLYIYSNTSLPIAIASGDYADLYSINDSSLESEVSWVV